MSPGSAPPGARAGDPGPGGAVFGERSDDPFERLAAEALADVLAGLPPEMAAVVAARWGALLRGCVGKLAELARREVPDGSAAPGGGPAARRASSAASGEPSGLREAGEEPVDIAALHAEIERLKSDYAALRAQLFMQRFAGAE